MTLLPLQRLFNPQRDSNSIQFLTHTKKTHRHTQETKHIASHFHVCHSSSHSYHLRTTIPIDQTNGMANHKPPDSPAVISPSPSPSLPLPLSLLLPLCGIWGNRAKPSWKEGHGTHLERSRNLGIIESCYTLIIHTLYTSYVESGQAGTHLERSKDLGIIESCSVALDGLHHLTYALLRVSQLQTPTMRVRRLVIKDFGVYTGYSVLTTLVTVDRPLSQMLAWLFSASMQTHNNDNNNNNNNYTFPVRRPGVHLDHLKRPR
jgi:hypothetical protein